MVHKSKMSKINGIPPKTHSKLIKIYYNMGSGSAYKGLQYLNENYPEYKKYWKIFLEHQTSYTINKIPKRKYQRRKYLAIKLDFAYQADLLTLFTMNGVDLIPHNAGHKYVLVIKDIVSNMVWLYPLKNKKCETVNAIFGKFFKHDNGAKQLMTDRGKEFTCKKNILLLKDRNVNYYYSHNYDIKASKAEIGCKQVRQLIRAHLFRNNTLVWVDILQDIEKEMNNTRSKVLGGLRPVDINTNVLAADLWRYKTLSLRNKYKAIQKPNRFKVGDYVRVSKLDPTFHKSSDDRYSTEIFQIYQVNVTIPVTYKLKDLQNTVLSGGFYQEELVKTGKLSKNSLFKISEILQDHPTDKKKTLVSWKGYSHLFNSYVNKSDIVENHKD